MSCGNSDSWITSSLHGKPCHYTWDMCPCPPCLLVLHLYQTPDWDGRQCLIQSLHFEGTLIPQQIHIPWHQTSCYTNLYNKYPYQEHHKPAHCPVVSCMSCS